MRLPRRVWPALLLWLTATTALADPEPSTNDPTARETATHEESKAHEESEFHRNHIGLFLGGITPLTQKHETSFAIGVGYERRFLRWLGLETWVDFAIGAHERNAIFLAGPTFHPVLGLRIITGLGFELGRDQGDVQVDYVIAVGAGWDFEVGPVILSPEFYFDFIGRETTNATYGVVVGYGF